MSEEPESAPPALLLDEMFSAHLARTLRGRGHDVVAVVENPELRALSDADIFAWAASHGRRILTENVKDYRPLLLAAQESGAPCAALLLTSSRTFPRSRNNPGPLTEALGTWLEDSGTEVRSVEVWLAGPATDRS
jgi:nucleoside-diphosphate-sugar epimerase